MSKSFEEYLRKRKGTSSHQGLNSLASLCHADAKALGWYDAGKVKTDLEALMLAVSELAECAEELRKPSPEIEYHGSTVGSTGGLHKNPKPLGVGVELADALIRILDYCAYKDIDIDGIVERKLNYNLTRGYMHGGKRF